MATGGDGPIRFYVLKRHGSEENLYFTQVPGVKAEELSQFT